VISDSKSMKEDTPGAVDIEDDGMGSRESLSMEVYSRILTG